MMRGCVTTWQSLSSRVTRVTLQQPGVARPSRLEAESGPGRAGTPGQSHLSRSLTGLTGTRHRGAHQDISGTRATCRERDSVTAWHKWQWCYRVVAVSVVRGWVLDDCSFRVWELSQASAAHSLQGASPGSRPGPHQDFIHSNLIPSPDPRMGHFKRGMEYIGLTPTTNSSDYKLLLNHLWIYWTLVHW